MNFTLTGDIAQLVRAFASHARGRGFESLCLHHIFGGVAQLGERSVRIREVRGSNPLISTKLNDGMKYEHFFKNVQVSYRRF